MTESHFDPQHPAADAALYDATVGLSLAYRLATGAAVALAAAGAVALAVTGYEHIHRGRAHNPALRLWKRNKITGLWDYQRSVTEDTREEWLAIFKRDEPDETFVVSRNEPASPLLSALKKNRRAR